jgi:hypothetical protein
MCKMQKYTEYLIAISLLNAFKYSQDVIVETENDHSDTNNCAGFISFQVISHTQNSS